MTNAKSVILVWALTVYGLASIAQQAAAQSYSFTPLGDLAGGAYSSAATAVSADGTSVVGTSYAGDFNSRTAFWWTSGTGMISLGMLPGGNNDSTPYGLTGNGQSAVGYSESTPGTQAFRWTNGSGMSGLGFPPDHGTYPNYSNARGVTPDGTRIVGNANFADGSHGFQKVGNGGFISLPELPGSTNGAAYGVSANGSVVVGYSAGASGEMAVSWTNGGAPIALGDLPGGQTRSAALGVSADGSTIVGWGTVANHEAAFRWTSAGGMVNIGSSFFDESNANAASANGKVVVGYGLDNQFNSHAFQWIEGRGIVNLKNELLAHGVAEVVGWQITRATGVSADGHTIVGEGYGPNGPEAWIMTVPEPTTWALAAMGLAGLLAAARRKMKPH
jgi:probable HAF family extracellular repeat protein